MELQEGGSPIRRNGPMGSARIPARMLYALLLVALGAAILLVNHWAARATGSMDQALGRALPGSVEDEALDPLAGWRALVAVVGSLALLPLSVLLGVAYLRRAIAARPWGRFFAFLSAVWISIVTATFLLGPSLTISLRYWEAQSLAGIVTTLGKAAAGQGLPGPGEVLYALGAELFLTLCCISLGLGLARLLLGRGWLEAAGGGWCLAVTSYLSGQALLSVALVLLAIGGHLSYWTVAGAFVACLAAGAPLLLQLPPRLIAEARRSLLGLCALPRGWQVVAALVALLVVVSMLQAWARLSWDAGTAYFASARLMALTGTFRYTNENHLALSGFNAEVMQAAAWLLFGERPARLLSWSMAGCYLISLALIGRRAGLGRRGVVLAVAMALTTTSFLDLAGDGKIDLFGAATALAAILWLVMAEPPRRRPALMLAGLLAGTSLLYRPTYVFPLALLCVVGALERGGTANETFRLRFRQAVPDCVLMAAFAALPPLFYLARNELLLGKLMVPVPPMPGERQALAAFFEDVSPASPGRAVTAGIRLAYPLYASFFTTALSLGTLSPLFLASVPLWLASEARGTVSAFGRRVLVVASLPITPILVAAVPGWLAYRAPDTMARSGRRLILAASIFLVVWLAASPFVQESRYVLAIWGLVFVGSAYLVEGALVKARRRWDRVFALVVSIVLVALLIRSVCGVANTTDRPAGGGQPECRGIPECEMIAELNSAAPPGARILVLAAYESYLRPDLLPCASSPADLQALRLAAAAGSGPFWDAVRGLGFSYVAYWDDYPVDFAQLDAAPLLARPPPWLTLVPLVPYNGMAAVRRYNGLAAIRLDTVGAGPAGLPRRCVSEGGRWVVRAPE